MTDSQTLVKFPCSFNFKALFKSTDNAEKIICQTISSIAPITNITQAMSAKKNYVSLTVTADLDNEKQLLTIYQKLNECPEVIMTL